MKKAFQRYAILVTILALGACAPQPIYRVDDAPIASTPHHRLTKAQIRAQIKQAGSATGWVCIDGHEPDTLRCTNRWRTHMAMVDIPYSTDSYSITLVSSENLKQGNGTIHRKYNQRVQALRTEIDKKIAQAL